MTYHNTLWRNRARVDYTRSGVVDGDTVDLNIDVGFYTTCRERVRLAGIDTAEIYGVSHDSDEYARGIEHARFVESWVADAEASVDGDWPFIVHTEKATGKYGRWVGDLQRRDTDEWLTAALEDEFGDAVLDD